MELGELDIPTESREAAYRWLDATRDADFTDAIEGTALLAAMLLLRWMEREDAEREAVAAFDEVAFEPTIPAALRWENWLHGPMMEPARFLRERLIPWLNRGCSGLRLERLGNILNVQERLHPSALYALVEIVDAVPIHGPNGRRAASALLEAVVSAAIDRGTRGFSGEFTTPAPVIELMLELADPKPGERIYDPCFGLGGLLAGCARRLTEDGRFSPGVWNSVQKESIFGVELRPVPYVIGLARTVLAGVSEPGLELGDALDRTLVGSTASERFDLILANPPWSGRRSEPSDHFRFRTSASESMFVQHIAESLRPDGRAVIVVPEGLLFRGGPERELREWLLQDFRIEGIISLPSGAFLPFTAVKANLLLVRKAAPATNVRFATVSHLLGTGSKTRQDSESPAAVAKRFRSGKVGLDLWETPISALMARHADLVATRPSDDDLENVLDRLRESFDGIKIVTLADVAEVRGGWNYKREDVVESEQGIGARLIRIGDFTDEGSVRPSSIRLLPSAGRQPEERFGLNAGDVLISTSGTLAKVVQVPDLKEPLVASKSVVTIKPLPQNDDTARVPFDYIAALLRSGSYQQWLLGRSTGSVIKHLNLSMLRRMPIPLPDLAVQLRVARLAKERGADAISILTNILTGSESDPVAAWLESAPEVRTILAASMSQSTEVLGWIESFTKGIVLERNKLVHSSSTTPTMSDSLRSWILSMADILRPLRTITRVPPGPSRYSLLEPARVATEISVSLLKDDTTAVVSTAREVTRRIASLLGTATQQLLSQTDFDCKLNSESVGIQGNREFIVRLRYRGPLPLRDIRIRTVPLIGEATVEYIADGDPVSVPMTIPADAKEGEFPFTVKWQAERLDGQTAKGESNLSAVVAPTGSESIGGELGPNPYINSGLPVTLKRSDVFFGRDDILSQIRRSFPEGRPGNVVLLVGNRRMGKTSILYRLRGGVLPGWTVAYCTLQEGGGSTKGVGLVDHRFFRLLAQKICDDLFDAGIPTWLPGVPSPPEGKPLPIAFSEAAEQYFATDTPFTVFEFYVESAIRACREKGTRLLLVIDEFDKLQEGIEAGVTSPTVPGNLRALLHRHADDLSAIFSGATALGEAQKEYWSVLHGFGYRIDVTRLSDEAARLLVTQPVAGKLRFIDEARDAVIDVCGRHPHLIQVVCNRIFEDAYHEGFRTVTVSAVDTAIEKVVSGNNIHFDTIWKELRSDRRRLLLALCDRMSAGDDGETEPVTLPILEAEFETRGIEIIDADGLANDLAALQTLELLTFTGADYRLTMPLFARWIRQKDIADLQRRAQREAEENKG